MHKQIKGTMPNGESYHALEPEPYAWVHATLADAIVRGNEHFIRPIPERDLEPFWAEWRTMGRLLGVRDRDLPERWSEFGDYFDWMIAERLERTESVDDVLEALEAAAATARARASCDPLWKAARLPARRGARIGMVGMMPPALPPQARPALEARQPARVPRDGAGRRGWPDRSCRSRSRSSARTTCAGAARRSRAARSPPGVGTKFDRTATPAA